MPTPDLARLYQQATVALVTAKQWLRAATTDREKEFASTAIRHARGLQVAAAAGQQEHGQ